MKLIIYSSIILLCSFTPSIITKKIQQQVRTYHWDQWGTGDCEIVVDLELISDGTHAYGMLECKGWTNSTIMGDYWHLYFCFRDDDGTEFWKSQEILFPSERMFVGKTYTMGKSKVFEFDPNLWERISRGQVAYLGSC